MECLKSHAFLAEQRSQSVRLRLHSVAIVNHGRNIATGNLASLRAASDIGVQESLEEIFLRLTQEAAAPEAEPRKRRGWFRRS